jgi:hypothetical protein
MTKREAEPKVPAMAAPGVHLLEHLAIHLQPQAAILVVAVEVLIVVEVEAASQEQAEDNEF